MENLNELNSALRQKEKELESIRKIGQALSNTLDLDDLLNLIMKEITGIMQADRSTLYLVDHQKKEIWSKIALKAEIKEIRQKFGIGISGFVAATGNKINIPDAYQDVRFDPTTDKRTGYVTRSILCIPVWEPHGNEENREILGVIQVLNKKDGHFTDEDEGILKAISSQVAISISNARLYQQLDRKYREIDLLYEFEQLLSAEFNLDILFEKLLEKTLRQLRSRFAAVVFPHKNQLRLLTVGKDSGGYFAKSQDCKSVLPDVFQSYLRNRLVANSPELTSCFRSLSDSEIKNLSYFPISLEGEKSQNAGLFFLQPSQSREDLAESDLRLLDFVCQKVSRAMELHALRESLLRQERLSAVGQMMSTIVHDLRSPVNSIYGFMELLMDESSTPEERSEYGDIIRMEIQSITNMTTEILDFAKGKTSILPRKCSAKEILKRFQPRGEQLFRSSGIRFDVKNTSRKTLYADAEKLTRVFYNIAKNAREAMKDTGIFSLEITDQNSTVIFELRDNGPGIPEEIRNRLFESFVTSGKEQGTGLGLAIVKKIIDDHHGQIQIESEIGKGTTFFISLPEYEPESD